jgi:methyl-branched lipid omega-hydroxylase
MWYVSANRGTAKYVDPSMFDVRRDPNPHLGFGGGGVHFCLGANPARREMALMFEELHGQILDISATEEPARLRSSCVHGIKRLSVAWTLR